MRALNLALLTTGAALALGLIVGDLNERRAFTCDTDAECAALPPCALKPGCDGGPYSQPYRLAGYGCEGMAPGAVLYADEEDHFPRCRRIEPTFGG